MSDKNCYPTEDEIDAIVNWPIGDYKGLMEFVKSIWWMPDLSWREQGPELSWREQGEIYHISTGGWSGNEEIISAMQDNNLFWTMCWHSSRRGGHYIFEIMEDKNV